MFLLLTGEAAGIRTSLRPRRITAITPLLSTPVDMIAAIRKLGIKKCCLANHSTGGIICTRMLLMEPAMFGKVFCLDPVAPVSVFFDESGIGLFRSMKENYEFAYSIMAGTSPSLFTPESMQAGQVPQFRDTATQEQRDLFKLIVDKTRVLSDGIWFGTPINLTKEYQSGELKKKQKKYKSSTPDPLGGKRRLDSPR